MYLFGVVVCGASNYRGESEPANSINSVLVCVKNIRNLDTLQILPYKCSHCTKNY